MTERYFDERSPVNRFGTPVELPNATPVVPGPAASGLSFGVPARRVGRLRTVAVIGGLLATLLVAALVFGPRAMHGSASPRAARPPVPAPTAGSSGDNGGGDVPDDSSAALTAPAPAEGPLITPQRATAVLDAMWPLREQAMGERDLATLSRLETGPALAGDRVRVVCGCRAPGTPRAVAQEEVLVTQQSSYPVRFLAEVRTDDDGQVVVDRMVFLRAAPSAAWRVELENYIKSSSAAPLDDLEDPDGYVAPAEPATVTSGHVALERLASYFQRARDTGRAGRNSWFQPGYWTTQWAAEVAKGRNGRPDASGLVAHIHYRAVPGRPLFAATLDDGWTVACGALERSGSFTGRGRVMRQDPARTQWNATLPPGDYRSIQVDGYFQTCVYLPPSGVGRVDVVGGDTSHETWYRGVPIGDLTV